MATDLAPQGQALSAAIGDLFFLRVASALPTSERQGVLIVNSARCGFFRLLRAPNGDPAGYVLWACVGREAYHQLLEGESLVPRALHEWDEGPWTLVLDVVVLPEWRLALTRQLLQERRRHRCILAIGRGRPLRRHRRPLSTERAGR